MKYYIDTMGCPKNKADSESAAGILERAGFVLTEDPCESDYIIVNTCGFIRDAKEESIDRILELAAMKKDGKYLVITGCLSQRYGRELFDALPEADLCVGVNDYEILPQLLEGLKQGRRIFKEAESGKVYRELGDKRPLDPPYTSYLKIAEGCNNICSYCSIPEIRGAYRSRKESEILKEAEKLAESGCKEIILVAQDVTAYGMDFDGKYHLPRLLEKLCHIEGIRWIRLMYCYEDRITRKLIDVIKENEKICRYLDIPLQHISDRILAKMNRRSTANSIRRTIKLLRESIPNIHIRTTFITGFPGETEEDFQKLRDFVNEQKFERLGVFSYSKEEGTPAGAMDNQIGDNLKLERRDLIMADQKDISLNHNMTRVGRIMEVLVDERDDENTYLGRTRYDAPEIDNGVIFTSRQVLMPGDMVKVKITDAFDYDLTGEALERMI
ncbi:MAG: 30S ribosomal protein S12 methylthiotransferase RimO [Anaerovoracaceae bacterium]|jgi:ribosomal protein S12 methylthiotransferase